MIVGNLFVIALITVTLLSALVAGIVLCFSIIVMPGTGTLDNRSFLRAFQVMDKVIQDNHPVFMLVWVGSIFAVIAVLALGLNHLSGANLYLLIAAGALNLLGVQLPTVRFNIPLNNRLQSLDLDQLSLSELSSERSAFESPWNRWNQFRTLISCISVLIFILLIYRI